MIGLLQTISISGPKYPPFGAGSARAPTPHTSDGSPRALLPWSASSLTQLRGRSAFPGRRPHNFHLSHTGGVNLQQLLRLFNRLGLARCFQPAARRLNPYQPDHLRAHQRLRVPVLPGEIVYG